MAKLAFRGLKASGEVWRWGKFEPSFVLTTNSRGEPRLRLGRPDRLTWLHEPRKVRLERALQGFGKHWTGAISGGLGLGALPLALVSGPPSALLSTCWLQCLHPRCRC